MRILGHVSLPEPLRRGPIRWEPRFRLNRCIPTNTRLGHQKPHITPILPQNLDFVQDLDRFASIVTVVMRPARPDQTASPTKTSNQTQTQIADLQPKPTPTVSSARQWICKASCLSSVLHHFVPDVFFCMRVADRRETNTSCIKQENPIT